MASLLARAPAAPPPADVQQEDLVLDRDELRMLDIFDRSFQLPGLRLGLLKPICSEDYYPEDEWEEEEETEGAHHGQPAASLPRPSPDAHPPPQRHRRPPPPAEPTPADDLRALLAETQRLHAQVDEVLEEEIHTMEEPEPIARPTSGAPVRSVRPHSGLTASARAGSGRRR